MNRRGAHTPEFIAKCCDAFRAELERRDLTEYVNSILTAHVVKTPPDHEAGLSLLLRLRGAWPLCRLPTAVFLNIFYCNCRVSPGYRGGGGEVYHLPR